MSNPKEFRTVKRTYSEVSEDSFMGGLEVVRNMGMPFLYIAAFICVMTGVICMSVITYYWANIENPTCFLFSQSAAWSVPYKFGSSLSNCYWVAYGPIPVCVMLIVCGCVYWFMVRPTRRIVNSLFFVMFGMIGAGLLMIAVCSTFAEGMRVTCVNMGLNPANNKGSTCKEKLDLRVEQYNLPVQTSTMVTATSATLWTGCSLTVTLAILHIASYWRRSWRAAKHRTTY